ncbi:hypothetical protein [Nocardia sp. NBC_00416]|uniref:hypothetical protein n=1 Tax=Nocardia sp. NBC_00416 TaxID=2975991 RepID=UPI002E232E77
MNASSLLRCAVVATLLMVSPSCSAVADSPDAPVELGAEFTLAAGASADLDQDRMTVLFAEVPEDSRCPEGTACMWAGDATIVAEVTVGAQRSRQELHSNRRFATGATVGGYRIELVAVHPSPPAGGRVPAADYRVDLLVTRA